MKHQPIEVAIAILYTSDRFLMQLRDNIPGIVYPGCWGLFGGHLEAGELPETAVKRELIEEINYTLPSLIPFRRYPNPEVIRHVYQAPLTVELNQLVLGEGWDMGLLTLEEIRQGECYSDKAGQVRPLGSIHQKILLDFINS
ncbi:MAG: NUDIX domain-containing protein [Symploca sp. SIO1A3]|nr:NUDIX domain-containing protein [Symploca sp. SIO1A3]